VLVSAPEGVADGELAGLAFAIAAGQACWPQSALPFGFIRVRQVSLMVAGRFAVTNSWLARSSVPLLLMLRLVAEVTHRAAAEAAVTRPPLTWMDAKCCARRAPPCLRRSRASLPPPRRRPAGITVQLQQSAINAHTDPARGIARRRSGSVPGPDLASVRPNGLLSRPESLRVEVALLITLNVADEIEPPPRSCGRRSRCAARYHQGVRTKALEADRRPTLTRCTGKGCRTGFRAHGHVVGDSHRPRGGDLRAEDGRGPGAVRWPGTSRIDAQLALALTFHPWALRARNPASNGMTVLVAAEQALQPKSTAVDLR